MAKSIPDNSPLIASNLVCRGCGEIMEPKIVKNSRGMVEQLEYEHRNDEVGCSYRLTTNAMVTAEMKFMRPDGTEGKL